MRYAFSSNGGHANQSRKNTQQCRRQLTRAVQPCLEALELRQLLSAVTIPAEFVVHPGDSIQVPVTIDNAADLMAVDAILAYDTNQLDITSADITRGSLLPGSWGAAFNPDDAAGTVKLSSYAMGPALTGGSGTLFLMTFHVPANAPSGESTLKLTGSLNESADGFVATSSLTVLGNETVLAKSDSYQTNEDAALTIDAPGVLANDQDLNGGTLSAVAVANPSHGTLTLNSNGSFTYTPAADFSGTDYFTYKAASSSSASITTKVTIAVNPVNDAPVAGDSTASVAEGKSVDINLLALVSDKETPAANIVLSNVALADPTSGTLAATSAGTYRFTPADGFIGDAKLTYKATDTGDPANINPLSDTGEVTIHVIAGNKAPVAVNDAATIAEDAAATGNVLTNDSDPESDPLTVVNGPYFINPDGSFTYTPPADFHGTKTYVYTVSDGQGNTTTGNLTITVTPVPDAPTAANDAYTTPKGTPLTIDAPGVLDNDNDVDGDAITAALVTQPSHGQLTLNSDGSFTYTPDAEFVGTDGFTYKTNDGALDSTPATVTISVTGELTFNGHVSIPTGLTVQAGQTIKVPVLIDNAAGFIGSTLTITYNTQLLDLADTGVLRGSVLPDTWQILPLVNDAAGTVTITAYMTTEILSSGSGSLFELEFNVPADAPLGTAALAITGNLNDEPLSAPVNGSLEIVGEPIPAVNVALPTDAKAHAGQIIHIPITIDNATGLTAADLDITYDTTLLDISNEDVLPGNLLTSSWVLVPNVNDALGTISFSAFAGEQSLAGGSGTIIDLVFHVAANAPVSTSAITLSGELNEGALPMNVTNGKLTITAAGLVTAGDDAFQTNEDTALTIAAPGVLANDTNSDGKALTAAIVTNPAHGALTFNPDGSFTYTPAADFNGTDSFTYKATTDTDFSTPATVSITVKPVNDAPVAASDAFTTEKDSPLTVGTPAVLANDKDLEGDPLTAALVTGPTHGQVTLNADGSFTYTPTAGFAGTDTFTYKANDGALDSAPATVTITVTGQPDIDAILTLDGTDQADNFVLSLNPTDTSILDVTLNGVTTSYPLTGRTSLVINALAGDDKVLIDATNGMPAFAGGIQVNGGTGTDKLDVNSTGVATVVANESTVTFNGVAVTFPQVELTGWDFGNGSSLTLSGNVVVALDEPMELASLTLNDSARLLLAQGGKTTFTVGDLNVSPTATLDATDNAIIVRNTVLTRQESYDSIVAAVKHARGTGKWLDTGLTSSVARAKAAAQQPYYGLAVVLNDRGNGKPIFTSIDGVTVGANDIVVKYALNGDTNLDGQLDAADYFRIDCGFISQFAYYAHGDLNFDDVIDAADYFLIDSAYLATSPAVEIEFEAAPAAQDVLALQAAPAQEQAAPSILQQLFSNDPIL